MTNLHTASRQWADRPADERFWDLEEMLTQCQQWRDEAQEINKIDRSSIQFQHEGNDILVSGVCDREARLLHYSFGQACKLSGAPADYLRLLPSDLAVKCLNTGLEGRIAGLKKSLSLLARDSCDGRSMDIRAITSGRYTRIWNSSVVESLLPLTSDGWTVSPARPTEREGRTRIATEEDCLKSASRLSGIGIKPGDLIAPAGLYASDKDMFAFMVNEDLEIGDGLFRGFFVTNSEVGDAAFSLTTFLYNAVCGNHIIWDAQEVRKSRVVHKGRLANTKANTSIENNIAAYSKSSMAADKEVISWAKAAMIGKNKEEVVDRIFDRRFMGRKAIESAYDISEVYALEEKYDPRSIWGIVQGITRLSQTTNYADKRVEMDRIAGDILSTTCT